MLKYLAFGVLLGMSTFSSTTSLIAQEKTLTLDDAIMKGYSSLSPQRLSGLQWLKESGQYAVLNEAGDAFILKYPEGKKQEEKVLLKDLNAAAELDLKRMPRVKWTSNKDFYFKSGAKYISYNIGSKKATDLIEIPQGAAHVDFNYDNGVAAYTVANNLFIVNSDNKVLAVVDVDDANVVSGQAIARHEFGISKGTFWSPYGNKLAFYQKDESKVGDYPLLDISSTPGQLRSIKYPMAGQGSEKASVGIFDVTTQKLIYLDVTGPEDQYLTNLSWSPDEQFVFVAVVNRDQNHMQFNQYDATSGALIKTLFEEKHDKYVEPENPAWFIPNTDNEFLWMSERDGFMHLYRYNLNGDMLGQVSQGNWVVKSILGLSQSGENIIVTGTDESGLNTYAYRINLESGKTKQLSKKSGSHYYTMSDDGIFLIDQYSSLNTPWVVDIINTRGKKVTNLQASTNPLADYKVGTTEFLELEAKDGTTLHARMIKPSNFEERKKYPVLVYVYGGPHAQLVSNRWLGGAPLWMHSLAEEGYIVFTLDNRGSANRGFEFENVIHRQLGTVEMEDQLVGVDYLKSLSYVDANRLAVHGWSFGGFMTTSLMLRYPGVFTTGVAGGPVTDWAYYEVMYGERYMDRPEENPEGYKTARLMEYADQLEGELLLIHGTVDDVVVMQHNLALVQAFVDAGKQVDFFPYPMHPHNVRGKDRVHLMTKVLEYIKANNK